MSLRAGRRTFPHFHVTFPTERIIQVTIDRPDKLNCIDKETSRQMRQVWEQFDEDDTLWVGIITGSGRAFCTGADLHGKYLLTALGGGVQLNVQAFVLQ